ncbi:IS5 family transposase [Pararhizobium sp. IMCC21322]|uniref:IS5 family transposase n=1 Tax=Pararhizobium sp. IMCC21322 TaxID=3067903 RepID=UPI00274226D8|nr:IS5 family transposase [Pararhizobium sp. IMCC21322]
MSDLFWLSDHQLARMRPYFPLAHGAPRVDDRRVISGIIFVLKNGLRWRDAPTEYGPHKTLYNRFVRWSRLGVFDRIYSGLSGEDGGPETLMIDATHLKAHRTACSLLKKGMLPRHIGRTKGGLNSKLHAVVNGEGKPIIMALTAGQVSDHIGAKITYPELPEAKIMIADKGYDSDEYRAALKAKRISSCIPPRKGRNNPATFCKRQYKQRHKVENMFGRLKDWRRIATRYDRCADIFIAAITIAAIMIWWI